MKLMNKKTIGILVLCLVVLAIIIVPCALKKKEGFKVSRQCWSMGIPDTYWSDMEGKEVKKDKCDSIDSDSCS